MLKGGKELCHEYNDELRPLRADRPEWLGCGRAG